jgi:DNA-binding transcriptional regulator YiaG
MATALSPEECKGVVTGAMLKRLRQELCLTQCEFGGYLKIPPGTIASWERRGELSRPASYVVLASVRKTYHARIQIVQGVEAARKALAE